MENVVITTNTAEKMIFLSRASKIWDTLNERQKGRLEGQLDVYEKLPAQTT